MNKFTETDPRKLVLSWYFPVLLAVAVLFTWFAYEFVSVDLVQIWERAPVVRIYWGALAVPLLPIFMLSTIVGIVMRAIDPESEIIFRRTSKMFMVTFMYTLLPSFILSPIITQLYQHFYLPEHGYTKCSLLQGNPTYYFSDWVKNPAWCVRGKSREWVFEQAGYSPEHAAPNETIAK